MGEGPARVTAEPGCEMHGTTERRIVTFCLFETYIAEIAVVLSLGAALTHADSPHQFHVFPDLGGTSLALDDGAAFHTTENGVENPRLIEVPDSTSLQMLWDERAGDDVALPWYAISLDGVTIACVKQTRYDLLLRYAHFDPAAGAPAMPPALTPLADSELFIVQFVTQPLPEFEPQLLALGARVYNYLGEHAYIARMEPAVRTAVAALPYVRAIVLFAPAYKLEPQLIDQVNTGTLETRKYNVLVLERGLAQQERVAALISSLGGSVHFMDAYGYRMIATLPPMSLPAVTWSDDVQFVDRWVAPTADMDVVRDIGGATLLHGLPGENYQGQGVRGEVMDTGRLYEHADFITRILYHFGLMPEAALDSHATRSFGVVFGDGTADSTRCPIGSSVPCARGLLPMGTGIFSSVLCAPWAIGFSPCDSDCASVCSDSRSLHMAELVNPQLAYRAVFQTNSFGNFVTDGSYGAISAEVDDAVFVNDIVVVHSSGNDGLDGLINQEAIAKNTVGVGGLRHLDDLPRDNDYWYSASAGPASDGRIKPDLCHFTDSVRTTVPPPILYGSHSGTSAAAPIVAGHVGLFFQLFADGAFGHPPNPDVFSGRCHSTTAKAMLVNTAFRYDWKPPAPIPNQTLTRNRQFWGMPDLAKMHELRSNMLIIDETDMVTMLQSRSYVIAATGASPLRVTLVYADVAGTTSSTVHRINDLSVNAISPSGVVYWGNSGLSNGNWSTSGGSADARNNVENVFIESPATGNWTVNVFADEINKDGHLETSALDADFALVVSGIVR